MNRRERRAFDRLSDKKIEMIKQHTLKQLKKQYPDMNFTKQEIDNADENLKKKIEIMRLYAGKDNV
jgi:hypothetical protein